MQILSHKNSVYNEVICAWTVDVSIRYTFIYYKSTVMYIQIHVYIYMCAYTIYVNVIICTCEIIIKHVCQHCDTLHVTK